jgi:hypothetical protein
MFSVSRYGRITALGNQLMLMVSISRMYLTVPLVNEIALRLNLTSEELKGYVAGSLTVDMNPDKSVSGPVFMANARSSNAQVFKASTVCLTRFRNTTEIMIRVRIASSSIGSRKLIIINGYH